MTVPPDPASAPAHEPSAISPPARRALAEAAARRAAETRPDPRREIGGRDGPDAVRYGDWEVKGLAADF